MKLLITGANGFVGKHLCNFLAEEYNEIIAVSRSKGEENDNIKFVSKELSSNTSWADILTGVDVVIHLAGRAHVMNDAAEDPYQAYAKVNIEVTKGLAQQAVKQGVKRFIFLSSIKVNGERTTTHAFTEQDKPMPEDDYGKTKAEAEVLLMQLAKTTGMEIVIIRPPLIYGQGVKANFKSLVKLSMKNIPLPFGAIKNKRSFVYIENLLDFIKLCIKNPLAANQVFLVSDDNDLSTTQLIRQVKLTGNKMPLLIPMPHAWLVRLLHWVGKASLSDRLCNNLQVDIGKAKTLLNWTPPYTVEAGINKTVEALL